MNTPEQKVMKTDSEKVREIQLDVFKKELRYYVIKRKHIKNAYDEARIKNLLNSLNLPDIECVVIEHDWPMYHDVWDMVKGYVETGKYQHQQSTIDAQRAEINRLTDSERYAWKNTHEINRQMVELQKENKMLDELNDQYAVVVCGTDEEKFNALRKRDTTIDAQRAEIERLSAAIALWCRKETGIDDFENDKDAINWFIDYASGLEK